MKLSKYISSQIITFFFLSLPPPSPLPPNPVHIHFELCCCFKILFFSCFMLFLWPHLSIMAWGISCWAMECKLTSLRSYIHIYTYICQAKHSNKFNVETYVIDFNFIYFLQMDVFHGNLILIGGVAMFFWLFLAQTMMPNFYSSRLIRGTSISKIWVFY